MKMVKIVVFVPKSHSDIVRQVMGSSGAGKRGLYSHCSFSSAGVGRFKPLEGSNPTIGTIGKLEEVVEERIECICKKSEVKNILAAIRKVHPYEEVSIDLYPLISESEL